ncbi:MAG: DUF4157 domain-containing protein [Terracidiphilus sp.]
MTSYSALALRRGNRPPAQSCSPFFSPSAAHLRRSSLAPKHLLPAQPSAIPVEAASPESATRSLTIGPAHSPLEAEADAMAAHTLTSEPLAGLENGARQATAAGDSQASSVAPPIVHEALGSPGQPLDSATRAFMEPRLGADLGSVHVHTGQNAAEAARAVDAQAYTVGQDIFFAAGKFRPHSSEGRRLLAHELSHTVQQSGGGAGLSSAAPAVHRDPTPKAAAQRNTTDADTKKPKTGQVTVPVPANLVPQLRLTPPSLLQPRQLPALGHPGASLLPPPSQFTPSTPLPLSPTAPSGASLTPGPQSGGSATPAAAPKPPDRVSIHDFGVLSIGVRIGFPDLPKDTKSGASPSALQDALKQGEILNFMFTHQPPSEYSIDPSKLVGALWGIFSTKISPGTAAKIAAGLASKPTGSGLTYQLDATILLDLGGAKPGGGGGLTLTVTY